MYLLASFYDTERSLGKEKIAQLRGICKSLNVPYKMVHRERMHLTIEGPDYEQCLKVNALNNFCAYCEIVLQSFPLVPENNDFYAFVKEIYGKD